MKRISRRNAIKGLGASSVIGLAGCLSDLSDLTGGSDDDSGIPSQEEGSAEWGNRLREHADEANIEWEYYSDDDITLQFGMGLHKYSQVTNQLLDAFEEHTGIEVEYDIFPEDEYWLEARDDLNPGGEGKYDGVMAGLWQAAELHEAGVVHDLNKFIYDDEWEHLSDPDWLEMDDFLEQTLELMTFPNDDRALEERDLVGFPNGVEVYGCIGCDRPSFEAAGLDDPADEIQNFEDLENAARAIYESDETDRDGIISRTSTTTLSSANWATMFLTHGGEWIDRSELEEGEEREARLNSEAGIESLRRFGRMMSDYGPDEPGQYDWYRANDALSVGETGIIYTTASTSGVINEEQFQQTEWLPPIPADEDNLPAGTDYDGSPRAATWVWSTAISQRSEHPGAAWLFIQFVNSRLGNYLLSTRQWDGHPPRAGTARLNFVRDMVVDDDSDVDVARVDDGSEPEDREDITGMPDEYPDWERIGMSESWLNAHIEGMSQFVSADPPPVPVDTPQNMPIMTEAARAMNEVVREEKNADTALDDVAPEITRLASEIDEAYLIND